MAPKKTKATRSDGSERSTEKISEKESGPINQNSPGTPISDAMSTATSSTSSGSKMAQDTSEEQPMLTEFTIFYDLPLEVRLHIWGQAAPEGVIVVQKESQTPGRRFVYKRSIPGVLHACRESRTEYLETDDPTDKTLQRRRRAHPVYKLHFQEGTVRSRVGKPGAFMSTEVDTFCGLSYRGKTPAGRRLPRWDYEFFSGIADLSIAKTLKHLAVSDNGFLVAGLESIKNKFPVLESVTLLIVVYPPQMLLAATSGFVFEAEVDGQLNESTFNSMHPSYPAIFLARFKNTKAAIQKLIEKNPTKNFPVVKWRFRDQAISKELAIEARVSEDEMEDE